MAPKHFIPVVAVAILGLMLEPARGVTVAAGVQEGTITSATLNEVSGIVGSRSIPDTLWVHNDSGDSARFFAISKQGSLLGQFSLTGATAVDWEDMAIGPKTGGGNYLYLADIGDNAETRSDISIYRVTEPQSTTSAAIAAANYKRLRLKYPDGAHNAESFFVDPISGDLYIVTKAVTGRVYRAPANSFDSVTQPVTLMELGNLNVALLFPTAADISPDGRFILIRNPLTTAYLYERDANQTVWDALQRTPIAVTLPVESQGEAIGWAADGKGFYTTSEFNGAGPRPIYYYAVAVPEPMGSVLTGTAFVGLIAGWRRKLARRRRHNA
jgi:hypothetical protein